MNSDLVDVIAELAGELPTAHVQAWACVLRTLDAPDRSTQAHLIEARPGSSLGGRAARLVQAWRAADPRPSGAALALALETCAKVHACYAARRTDVVISGPVSDEVPTQLTSSVITDLIRNSQNSLLVVSFAAFGVSEVTAELKRAADRGVRIDLILESTDNKGGTLKGAVGGPATFSSLAGKATFWIWPAEHRPVVGTSRAALHAKLIAADEREALLGSANLTDKALSHNLELGLIVRDPEVVRRVVHHFRSLMRPGHGPLVPLVGVPRVV